MGKAIHIIAITLFVGAPLVDGTSAEMAVMLFITWGIVDLMMIMDRIDSWSSDASQVIWSVENAALAKEEK